MFTFLARLVVLIAAIAFSGGAHAQVALTLTAGWNLLGNSSAAPIDVAATFGDASKITSVWKWNQSSSNWAFYAPAMTASTLTAYAQARGYDVFSSIASKEGFWVNASKTATLSGPLSSGVTLSESGLQRGWNLVSSADYKNPSQLNQELSSSLNAAGKAIETAWAWDALTMKWKFFAPSLEAQGSSVLADYITSKLYLPFSTALSAADGYWLNIISVTPSTATTTTTSTSTSTTTITTASTTTTTRTLSVSEVIDRTASQWIVNSSTSSLDGIKTTTILASGGHSNFRIYCTSDGKIGYYIITDFVTGSGYFKYRIGHNPVVTQYWTESSATGYKRLYPSSFDMTLLKKMYQNWDFSVQLDRFNVGIIEDGMGISGFPAAIDKTRADCGWPSDIFPPNNGWSDVYPDPPADAKEATYVQGSAEQFGLIAWRATNPSGAKQLLVRIGENKALCAGGYLKDDHRLYVEQDGKRVSAVSGTDFRLSCPNQHPATFALQGDFDPSRAFVLKAYPFHYNTISPGQFISSVSFD